MIFELQDSIDATIQKLWPEVKPTPYYPSPNPELGDLSTDVLFAVSKLLKQSPELLAEKFYSEIKPELKKYIFIERGFINIRIETTFELINSYYPLPILDNDISIAVVSDAKMPLSTNVRVCLASSMHGLLCQKVGQKAAIFEFDNYRSAKEHALSKGGFLWIASGLIRGDTLSLELRHLRNANINLVMPDPKWCTEIDTIPIDIMQREDLFSNNNFRYYISGKTVGFEIDWSVPSLTERANTWSYIQTTSDRLKRFEFKSNNKQSETETDLIKSLIKRRYLFKAVQAHAAQTGFVWEYISFLSDFLDDINHMLNNPGTRKLIENRALSKFEAAFFSTLGEVTELM